MSDDRAQIAVGLSVIAIICALTGSCIHDYAKSSPRVIDVLVTDKHYSPPYTTTDCSTDSKGHTSCSTTYHPPSWSVEYADEFRHWTTVSQGTYELLRIGEKKVLSYDQGGGFWGARYFERFEFGPLVAEGALPPR